MATPLDQPTTHVRDWVPGTVGEDVMTVHRLRDGEPICGAVGEADYWQRRVTCSTCLSNG